MESIDLLSLATVVGIVIGVVQVLKWSGLPTRFAPLASLLLGVTIEVFAEGYTSRTVLSGIIVGLMSSGLWSGVKTSATSTPVQVEDSTLAV